MGIRTIVVESLASDPLPCPFCGERPVERSRGTNSEPQRTEILCVCDSFHVASVLKKTREEAVELWNRRAPFVVGP